MRAELCALVGIEAALEKISHDARLDKLPVRFAGNGEFADLVLGQFEDGRVLEKVAVEMPNLVLTKRAALRHGLEKVFQDFGEVRRIIDTVFEDVGDDIFRKQSGVFGEETEDDAIEKPRDAKILALSDGKLAAGLGVDQFDGLAFL
jgi:hypothetical protein